jgi:chromosomal replication initiation ATPase DnaA
MGLPFDWAGQSEADPFIASAANQDAVQMIEHWADWPIPIAILSGPRRSGRTTLGRLFANASGGEVLDDVESMTNEALFHAWNLARDSGKPLLMIAQNPPAGWQIHLPDLRSRIAAATHAHIAEPDDILVRALFESGLTRGGSAFSADLTEWLSLRIERSYNSVSEALKLLNQASLSSGRKISVPFAKEALQNAGFLPIDGLNPEA